MKKFLKIILIFLLVLGAIVAIGPAFISADSNYEQSVMINAPKKIIFKQVNNLENWELWSPWKKADPEMKSEYSGPDEGEGATRTWKSESQGNGKMVITESHPHDSLKTHIMFEDRGEGHGYWKFIKNENGVKTTWGFNAGDMGYFGRWFNLLFAGVINDMLSEGLNNLKLISEEKAEMFAEKSFDRIKEESFDGQTIIVIKDSTSMDKLGMAMGQIFGELSIFMEKNNVSPAGPPLSIYHTFDPAGLIIFESGMPVNMQVEEEGRVQVKSLPAGKVVTITHFGPYDAIHGAHEIAKDYIETTGYSSAGMPWESYITDPMVEKDTSKWETKLYYPVN